MRNPFLFLFVLINLIFGFSAPAFAIGNKADNKAADTPSVISDLDQEIYDNYQSLNPSSTNCVAALKSTEEILSQMKFKNYNDEMISSLSLAGVGCASANQEFETAIRIADFGLPYGKGEVKDFILIGSALSAYALEKPEKFFAYLEQIDFENSAIFNYLEPELWGGISRFAYQTKDPEKNQYLVLKALYNNKYSTFSISDKIQFTDSYIFLDAKRNPSDPNLKELIFKMNNVHDYLNILVDKRFEFVKDYENYDDFSNIQMQVLRMEKYVNTQVVENPKELGLINKLARIQRYLGKSNETLIMLDKAIAKAASDPKYFVDSDTELNWTYEEKARALLAIGKTKEGFQSFVDAMKIAELGNKNISQQLNYIAILIDYGNFKSASKLLGKTTDKRSKYGDGLVFAFDGCIKYKTNDKNFDLGKVEKELSSIGEVNNGFTMVGFYSCIGDVDNTANSISKLLDNPLFRAEALVEISGVLSAGEYRAKNKNEQVEIIRKALKNKDLMDKINQYGNIINIPLDNNNFGF